MQSGQYLKLTVFMPVDGIVTLEYEFFNADL